MLELLLFQMDVEFGNPQSNFQKIKIMLEDNQPNPNTLVVLPELFLTGYDKKGIEESAFSIDRNKTIEDLSMLALKYDIGIYGSIAEFEDGNYYNTGVFITKQGLLEKYRKAHLFGPMGENSLFKSGEHVVTINFNDNLFGLSICYDLRFPSMYQILTAKGAGILLVVAEWPIARVNHWSALLRSRAIENQSYVIGVNRVGQDPDYQYGGHSAIFSPYGDEIIGFDHSNEEAMKASIDLSLVSKFRDQFDVRKDRIIGID